MSATSLLAVALAAAVAAPEAAPSPEVPPAPVWPTTTPPPVVTPAPVATPAPVVAAPAQAPAPAPAPDQTLRRTGNGMLVGAAILFTAGSAFNVTRAFVASGTCQAPGQPHCSASWFATSTGAWLTNIPAIALATAAGEVRGRADANESTPRRKHTARIVGPVVGTLGLLTNLTLRFLWIHDYATPRDVQAFDFARRGDAMLYYGGLQVSSIAIGAGLGATLYGHAHGPQRRVSVAPVLDRTTTGLMLSGRF